MPAFNSPSGIPFSDVNPATMMAHSPKWSPDSSTSEVTTIQLEFRDLSRITHDPTFENVIILFKPHIHYSIYQIPIMIFLFVSSTGGRQNK